MGFEDAYRVKYPDPVKYPGITWPSDIENMDVQKIVKVPADVRDRIDYTFYRPDPRLTLQDVVIFGPSKSVARHQRVEETGQDRFVKPKGEWPSDHKGVLVTFTIGSSGNNGSSRSIHGTSFALIYSSALLLLFHVFSTDTNSLLH